jgi:hypothetical protein
LGVYPQPARGLLVALSALSFVSLASRAASAQATPGLPADAQARLARAKDALRAGNAKGAADIAGPLFDAYPDDYSVQDLSCQSAILQFLPREEIKAQCAGLKRLAALGVKPSPSPPPPAPVLPPLPGPPPRAASEPPPAASESRPVNAEPPATDETIDSSSSPSVQAQASEPPAQRITTVRDLTARRYTGLGWTISPGVVFEKNGTAGFSFGAQVEYGIDTGSVIAMPGVSVTGYFAQPNVYVEMPTMKLVLPIGALALFVEGGAGVGEITNPGQAAPALLGAGGFTFHPGPSILLGLEAGYEALLGTDFQAVLLGPIFAVSF